MKIISIKPKAMETSILKRISIVKSSFCCVFIHQYYWTVKHLYTIEQTGYFWTPLKWHNYNNMHTKHLHSTWPNVPFMQNNCNLHGQMCHSLQNNCNLHDQMCHSCKTTAIYMTKWVIHAKQLQSTWPNVSFIQNYCNLHRQMCHSCKTTAICMANCAIHAEQLQSTWPNVPFIQNNCTWLNLPFVQNNCNLHGQMCHSHKTTIYMAKCAIYAKQLQSTWPNVPFMQNNCNTHGQMCHSCKTTAIYMAQGRLAETELCLWQPGWDCLATVSHPVT